MGIFRNIKESLVHYTWDLAYFEYNSEIITHGVDFRKIHIVKNPYNKKWFADPFILRDTERELALGRRIRFDCEERKNCSSCD